MGMLEPLTAAGLGRSPYYDVVVGTGERPVTLRNQSYDSRGRPINNLSRELNRRTIRSHNEVMHVIGVAEHDSSPAINEALPQKEYATYEATVGYRMHRVSFTAINAGLWCMNGLRDRLLVWRNLGRHPLHELVKGAHLEPGSPCGKLLLAGLPTTLAFKLLERQWLQLPTNNPLSFSSLRHYRPWAIRLWTWLSFHTQIHVILQRVGLIQGYWLPNPLFYVPWSSVSPIPPPPPLPSDFTTASLARWAGQALLTIAPILAYATWVSMESRVHDFLSNFFRNFLPTPQTSGIPHVLAFSVEEHSSGEMEDSAPIPSAPGVSEENNPPPYYSESIPAAASEPNTAPQVGFSASEFSHNPAPANDPPREGRPTTTLQRNDSLVGPDMDPAEHASPSVPSSPLSPNGQAIYTDAHNNSNTNTSAAMSSQSLNYNENSGPATPSSPNATPNYLDASDVASTHDHTPQQQHSSTPPRPVPDPPSQSEDDEYGSDEDEADVITGPLISFDVEPSDSNEAATASGPWSAELRPTPINDGHVLVSTPIYLVTLLSTQPHFMACKILTNFVSNIVMLPLEFVTLRYLAGSYMAAHPVAAASMLAAGHSIGALRLTADVTFSTISNILNLELTHLIAMGDVWAIFTLIGRQMHYTMKEWCESSPDCSVKWYHYIFHYI
ncbi:hypothetical protein CFO_g1840 [Ceratocystis platani]|uniref:Uncharacterized protein n=1 Tax=Ceratocystis fimbriata f. sp. platani TaxID=88771 RepID=A0A0F8CYW2_CERFI|nr:hypothetical protein CFO_g1840 [Ceratocystis platani]